VVTMKKPSRYTTIGIAAGLFAATHAGIAIASYVKSRKKTSKKATISDTRIDSPQYAAEYAEVQKQEVKF
jgi:phosphomannomutase